jgi:hypothetical protein
MWILGLTTFYLSLALVYDSFTWYFLMPTLLLSLMAGIYLQQIVTALLKIKSITDNTEHLTFKVYFLLTLLVLPLVYYFDTVILSNLWTTLLSGCIWFPQIFKNARFGNRNTPKMRHVIPI